MMARASATGSGSPPVWSVDDHFRPRRDASADVPSVVSEAAVPLDEGHAADARGVPSMSGAKVGVVVKRGAAVNKGVAYGKY